MLVARVSRQRPKADGGVLPLHSGPSNPPLPREIPMAKRPVEERFWPKVSKRGHGGCWIWMGAKTPKGYGVIHEGPTRNSVMYAHRLSYEWANGPIPTVPKWLHVRHSCDTPACVRPSHLLLGTPSENQIDAFQRNADNDRRAKLNPDKVRAIRKLSASGRLTKAAIGARFGVAAATIKGIIYGKAWTHVV